MVVSADGKPGVVGCVAGHEPARRAERIGRAAFDGMTIMPPGTLEAPNEESAVDPLHSNESAQIRSAPPMLRVDK